MGGVLAGGGVLIRLGKREISRAKTLGGGRLCFCGKAGIPINLKRGLKLIIAKEKKKKKAK